MSNSDAIVITAAKRTPIGHFCGNLQSIPAPRLGAHAIQAVLEQAPIDHQHIHQVSMGCVLPAGLGQAPARQAAHYAGLPQHVPCTTVNKMCGSGMETILQSHDRLRANRGEVMIAGGMENMSQAPYLSVDTRQGARIGNKQLLDHMMHDGLEDAYHEHQPMGNFAELCADKYGITREQQDAYALASIERAIQATQSGAFQHEIAPIDVKHRRETITITEDEGILHAKPEKVPTLRPAFKQDGTVTAANASNISDGAAAIMMMRQSTATALNATPLAKICGISVHAQAPEWFTTAPIGAIQSLLKQLDWDISTVDCFEINEAFAVVPLVAMQELNLPHDKVNVNGGACVLGHPVGASGTRILITLINILQQRNLKRGIAALCIGGGEATAVAIEII
jgi:acetyl-CoA C-acetyltransferase